uniref:Arm_2 domain-containing protein n=1 Tax=Syphacia muris TaxID=451379 RepID=A0A0N5ALZ4_9BILA
MIRFFRFQTMGKDISSLCVRYGGYMISRIAENSHGFSRESRAPLAICALMNHCNSSELTKHLLSSPHLPIRVLILDILEICICSLKNFYNEILPLLHQNWPGILCRLHDREVHVQLRAFEVLLNSISFLNNEINLTVLIQQKLRAVTI